MLLIDSTLISRARTVNHVIIVCWETSQKDEFESVVSLLNLSTDPRDRTSSRGILNQYFNHGQPPNSSS